MVDLLLFARFTVAIGVILISVLLLIKKHLIAKYAKQAEIGVGLNLTRDRMRAMATITNICWVIVSIVILALGAEIALTFV